MKSGHRTRSPSRCMHQGCRNIFRCQARLPTPGSGPFWSHHPTTHLHLAAHLGHLGRSTITATAGRAWWSFVDRSRNPHPVGPLRALQSAPRPLRAPLALASPLWNPIGMEGVSPSAVSCSLQRCVEESSNQNYPSGGCSLNHHHKRHLSTPSPGHRSFRSSKGQMDGRRRIELLGTSSSVFSRLLAPDPRP